MGILGVPLGCARSQRGHRGVAGGAEWDLGAVVQLEVDQP